MKKTQKKATRILKIMLKSESESEWQNEIRFFSSFHFIRLFVCPFIWRTPDPIKSVHFFLLPIFEFVQERKLPLPYQSLNSVDSTDDEFLSLIIIVILLWILHWKISFYIEKCPQRYEDYDITRPTMQKSHPFNQWKKKKHEKIFIFLKIQKKSVCVCVLHIKNCCWPPWWSHTYRFLSREKKILIHFFE